MVEKICFIISPIGEEGSDTRKRSDLVLKHVISPAVEDLGYKPLRADHISEPGMITSQVIQYIIESPLVIADLTERNPNVFYELALRHAIRKPLVQLISKGENIPFDVAGTRTIYLDHRDLESVSESKEEIKKQIAALERDPTNVETPISVSMDLQLLRKSEDPQKRTTADILSSITELQQGISTIEKSISSINYSSLQSKIEDLFQTRSNHEVKFKSFIPLTLRAKLQDLRWKLERDLSEGGVSKEKMNERISQLGEAVKLLGNPQDW